MSDVALPSEATNFGRYRSLFRNRNFRLWFASASISSLGDWAGLFALQSLVASLSDQGSRVQLFSLGAIMMARTLPSLLMGPVAGVFADRYDRKRLMVVTDVVRAAMFVVIAFTGDLVALFALTFIVESMSLLFASAKDATLTNLVDRSQLTEANQLNLVVTYGTLPLGGLMGVLLAGLSSLLSDFWLSATSLVLLLDAVTFLVSAQFMARLRVPRTGRRARPQTSRKGMLDELREGWQFMRHMPVIRALIVGVMGIFFGGGVIFALGPALVDTTSGGQWYTVVTLVGAGLVLGMVLSAAFASRFPKERVLGIAMVLTAAIAAAIALVSTFTSIAILAFLLGAAVGLAFVLGYTLLHEQTFADPGTRGTTFATFYTGTRASMFLALGAAPLVAGTIGRFSISVGAFSFSLSGLRITILAAALLALYGAFATSKALWMDRDDSTGGGAIAPSERGGGSGLFIAFEGVEGAGKSTQVELLASRLRDEGHEVVITREPGGHPVAERIRGLLLDDVADDMGDRTEALLYSAARAQLVDSVIQPALDDGAVVMSDRFTDSSLAYQGGARELGRHQIREINQWATRGLRPDVVVWLKLDPGEGLERVDRRGQQDGAEDGDGRRRDRIEQEELSFHERVARTYAELAREGNDRWITVDAGREPSQVADEIRTQLQHWLPLVGPGDGPAADGPAGDEPAADEPADAGAAEDAADGADGARQPTGTSEPTARGADTGSGRASRR